MRKNFIALIFAFVGVLSFSSRAQAADNVPQWSVHELSYVASGKYQNLYTEVARQSVFARPDGVKQAVKGFWDGGQTFNVRFTRVLSGSLYLPKGPNTKFPF
jgi:hypothetical protein